MPGGTKRKDEASGASGSHSKRKRVGNGGKWKTTHHESKATSARGDVIQPGDTGIWITCARGQEKKAAREVDMLFGEYLQILYGYSAGEDAVGESQGADGDIEAAIRKEVEAMSTQGDKSAERIFTPLRVDVECILFVRTSPPIDPVQFAKHICVDARATTSAATKIRSRYLNRLTPVTASGKATEDGLIDVAKVVLSPFFDLSGKKSRPRGESPAAADDTPSPVQAVQASQNPKIKGTLPGSRIHVADQELATLGGDGTYSFAIRPTIRNHNTLNRTIVIDQIASLINDEKHKVDLKSPDKVILVDIYKNICCMSVVDGDWEELKKFNLTELYGLADRTNKA